MKKYSKMLVIAALGVGTVSVASDNEIRLRANLTGKGKGKVVWKQKDRGARSEAELQAEGENLPRNTTYTITVGGINYVVKTNNFGVYRLEQNFRGGARPQIAVGDTATVKDAAGAVVQQGKFVRIR